MVNYIFVRMYLSFQFFDRFIIHSAKTTDLLSYILYKNDFYPCIQDEIRVNLFTHIPGLKPGIFLVYKPIVLLTKVVVYRAFFQFQFIGDSGLEIGVVQFHGNVELTQIRAHMPGTI